MPTEGATYISQLDATNPTGAAPKSEGDDQFRQLKSVLKAQFPNFGAAALSASNTQLDKLVTTISINSGAAAATLDIGATSNVGIGAVAPANAKVKVVGGGATTSTVELVGSSLGSNDNATISTPQSLVFQVDSGNAVTGRSIVFRRQGKGYSDGVEIAQFDADTGALLVGTSGSLISTASRLRVQASPGTIASDFKGQTQDQYVSSFWNSAAAGDNYFLGFFSDVAGTSRGSVTFNRAAGLVAYNTTSDYRAKEVFGPVVNPGLTIDSIRVHAGRMKGASIVRPMFVAHELKESAPYAVTGEKDAVDASGMPLLQQVDASTLVPLLVAEVQSIRARLEALEG